MRRCQTVIALLSFFLLVPFCFAQDDTDNSNQDQVTNEAAVYGDKAAALTAFDELEALSRGIQDLKQEVVDLNKDLRVLEETLLFPSSTKYTFFISMEKGEFFTLESVKLKMDGKLVVSHLYDKESRNALARGGIQRLYTTNLSEGKHRATVFFTGLGPNETPFKRASEVEFEKRLGEGYMEIAIIDNGAIQEPEFKLKKW